MAASESFPWRPLELERSWLAAWEQRRTGCSPPEQAAAQLRTPQIRGEAEEGTHQQLGLAQLGRRALESTGDAEPGASKREGEARQSNVHSPGEAVLGTPQRRADAMPGTQHRREQLGDPVAGHRSPYLDDSDAEEPRHPPRQAQELRDGHGQQALGGQRRRGTAPWQHSLAGGLAGMGTTALLYPFDIVRTRMQVHDAPRPGVTPRGPTAASPSVALPKYRNTMDAIATITRTEGLRGLYAGLYPSLLGSTVSWGLYFLFYNNAKQRYRGHNERAPTGDAAPISPAGAAPHKQLSAMQHLAAATEAGVLSTVVTNPIWVVKTRLQLQVHSNSHTPSASSAPSAPSAPGLGPHHRMPSQSPQAPAQRPYYRGFHDALRMILKEEGFMGLYKGLGPGLLLVSHGSIQFLAYEELKQWTEKVEGHNALHGGHFLVLGAASKLCAVLLTYPYQVLRSRMQVRPAQGATHAKYRTSLQAAALMYRNEGFAGFYKGLSPNLLRVLPSSSLTFFIYETLMGFVR